MKLERKKEHGRAYDSGDQIGPMAIMIDIPFNEYLVFFFFVSPKRTILIFIKTNLYRNNNFNWKQLFVINHLLRQTNKQKNKQTNKQERK